MKIVSLRTLCLVASMSLPCVAPAADGAPAVPIVVPAVRVAYAASAAMLATARAGNRIVAVGDHGMVLLSDDAGKTQRQARAVPVDVTLTGVSFIDANRGWAVGHWGVILSTTDGGEHWALQRIAKTEDRPLFAVHFFEGGNGVAVGLWSLVLVTNDGGHRWEAIEMPIPVGAKKADLNLFGLFADSTGRLFAAAERGMVLRSDDMGHHWRYLPTGYKGSFWTGVAPSDGTLLVAGLRGSLYRSGDVGATWQRIETHSKSSITALAIDGHEVIGVGLDGLVLSSGDEGASFTTRVRADHAPLTAIGVDGKDPPILYSSDGVLASEPAGAAKK